MNAALGFPIRGAERELQLDQLPCEPGCDRKPDRAYDVDDTVERACWLLGNTNLKPTTETSPLRAYTGTIPRK